MKSLLLMLVTAFSITTFGIANATDVEIHNYTDKSYKYELRHKYIFENKYKRYKGTLLAEPAGKSYSKTEVSIINFVTGYKVFIGDYTCSYSTGDKLIEVRDGKHGYFTGCLSYVDD